MAFEDDIQGQNTQLYPVVVIDGAYYSTNNVTIDGNYCKPILMNIPSIKESIDIESRKFKISNVTLDFNNFPFEGVRFSDQLSETSLINKEAIIYYKSPSTNTFEQMYELFRGTIRRITHDDSKATVELEDLTEKEAHRDLPQAYTPDAEYVSDKYKNKPIPIVYGYVDKSPTIIHTSKIVPDARLIYKYNDNPLYIDLDGTYAGVPKQIIENFGDAYVEVDDEEQVVVYSENDTQFVEEDSLLQNIFSRVLDLGQNPLLEANLIQITEKNKKPEGFSVSTNTDTADLHELDTLNDAEMQSITDGNSATFVENTHSNDIDYNVNSIFYKHKMFGGESRIDFFSREDKISKNSIFFLNGFRVDSVLGIAYWNLGSFTNGSIYDYGAEYTDVEGNDNLGLFTYNLDEYNNGHRDFYFNIQNIVYASDPSITSNLTEYDFVTFPLFYVVSSNSGLLTLRPYFLDDVAYNQADLEYSLRIRDIYREDWGNIKNPLKNNFYVDINGRINTFDNHPFLTDGDSSLAEFYDEFVVQSFIQNPIDIIYDILRSELGLTAEQINEDDYEEARTEHSDWKFAFTLNKKMNSKKLIEDIAKSTKCFPRFRNDGTFGFNTIKDSYSILDYNSAHPIKESDVISYSFKKTKPEQIYRQVDVQYNMDYAQNSLLGRTTLKDSGASDFYGIESSDDAYLEFESPYIRTIETAENLRDFLAAHYKNDHLLFNLKLPLQYINLEISQIVKFEELFQGLKAYGIDYRVLDEVENNDGEIDYFFPLFMITSITKNLDSISIECMQLHYLGGTINFQDWESIRPIDADSLTITPFIPESEELLGEELITNNDFTNGLSNWAIGYPNGSAFDNSENISVSNNQVTMTGTTSLDYIAKVNLINAGDTRLYRLTIDIESFEGEKWDVSANGVTYPDGTGASIRSQHQTQSTGVFTTEFVWNNVTHGQVPGNFEQNYGIRINSIGTMVLNSVSLRRVIQEGQANLLISGGTFENPDNWTPPNGNLNNTKIEDGFLSLIDISSGGTARDNTIINTTLTDDLVMSTPIGDFYYSQERFDIEVEVEGNGGLFKLGHGNSQAYFDVSGVWWNVQTGINKFTGIRVSSTSDYNNFQLTIFLHPNFDYGKIKSISIVPSASQGSSVAMKRKTYIVQLIEDGIHFQDSKYDLKDLKDME